MYKNYNDIYKKKNKMYRSTDDNMMYYPSIDYIQGADNNFANNTNNTNNINNNFQYNNSYGNPYMINNQEMQRFGQYNQINVNTMQMRNTLLKNQYPKIYDDINNIISELIPSYRNTSMGIDIVDEMVDKIYTSYMSLQENKEENLNTDVRKANDKVKQDRNINNDESNLKIEKQNDNDTLRDLIKILLITRLIKFNLDNTNVNNMYQRYNPYNYEMRSGFIGNENDIDQIYMGYRPRNYF